MSVMQSPLARGPLVDVHQQAGATLESVAGWQVAVRYPGEPAADQTVLIDLSHWPAYEVNGPETSSVLQACCGRDVALRTIHSQEGWHAYRLSPTRGIVFGRDPGGDRLDVTGGWATVAVCGPQTFDILAKVTALDLRERTLPVQGCCQGPIFGVNTLFGRFPDRCELHVCTDSAEFLWEVLLDAGEEFHLRPAGLSSYAQRAASASGSR